MTNDVPPASSPAVPSRGPPSSGPEGSASPLRAGEPAPPGTFGGRAREFREQQAERRSARRERVGQLLVVAILVLGVIAIVTARPFNPSSGSSGPNPGPPITVTFASPTVRQLTCGNGGTGFAEKIVWSNASAAVTTGDLSPRVYEIFDGDPISDLGVVANVTSTNLCAGSPPNPSTQTWYIVLQAPNGTTLLSYTVNQGWTSVTHGAWNIPIENGSSVIVVSGASFANRGLGFAVVGFASGGPIRGTVPL